MTNSGWTFLLLYWIILILTTFWSYRIILSEPHVAVGILEDETHHETCDLIEDDGVDIPPEDAPPNPLE